MGSPELECSIKDYEKALSKFKTLIRNSKPTQISFFDRVFRFLLNSRQAAYFSWVKFQQSKCSSYRQDKILLEPQPSVRLTKPSNAELTSEQSLKEASLDLLLARSTLHNQLEADVKERDKIIRRLESLDDELEGVGDSIAQYGDLEKWRKRFKPHSKEWWWFFKPSSQRPGQHDWIWKIGSITAFTVSLALLANMVPRFFAGGPDAVGATLIAFQSVITLITAQGALTTTWNSAIEEQLNQWGWPRRWQVRVRCLIAFGLLGILLLSYYLLLPWLSGAYNRSGLNDLELRQTLPSNLVRFDRLAGAQAKFSRAIALKPDNTDAYYNLGLSYEYMQMTDKARSAYQLAAQGGASHAYNSLGRLEILEQKYDAAVVWLKAGLKQTQIDPKVDRNVTYTLYKNLGWARLKQNRFQEAQVSLQKALKVYNDRSAPYCLLAQTNEQLSKKNIARENWLICLKLTSQELLDYDTNPKTTRFPSDEDRWQALAEKCLKPEFLNNMCSEGKTALSHVVPEQGTQK